MKVDEAALSRLSIKHATQTPFCDVLAIAPHKTTAGCFWCLQNPKYQNPGFTVSVVSTLFGTSQLKSP
jgi:hypothetical protein